MNAQQASRDRDPAGRPRNARPRDALGRPLPKGAPGVERVPDDYAPDARCAIADAIGYLAEERPFHAHEVLEARWKTGPPEERELWQGLAQICVGLTHLQRGNTRGAATLLDRGADRIVRYESGTSTDLETSGPGPAGHAVSGAGSLDLAEAVRLARDLAEHPPADATAAITRLADVFRASQQS
ncbi:DUF309 domain-containing protein [Sphaerisporangium perillae]|uniref:DUF309 domain-containing protein n=1 Tax=Sphaerisporangium perillae TaxID=2935860 RepID=UPI0020108476|nr:DUF309 domain-containing protein [Sphaerisporangium perillae]